jgi:peptidoglycan/LPS O-acetylase OafA/YrhL
MVSEITKPGGNPEWTLEFFRGWAAVMVVFAHYHSIAHLDPGLLRFAFTGVDLFFVISGFVFAPYLFGRRLQPVPFLIRRLFRIYPLYVVALLCYAGLHWLHGAPNDYFFTHLFFLQTTASLDIAFYYNPALWSLPPEVEFYLVLPLLALLMHRGSWFVWMAIAALLVHLMVAMAFPLHLDPAHPGGWALMSVHLPGLLIEFFIGSCAWLLVRNQPVPFVRWGLLVAGVLSWFGLAWVFSGLFAAGGDQAIVDNAWLRGNLGMLAAVSYALVVSACVGAWPAPPAWVRQGALGLGHLSYGLYLLHNATPQLLQPVAGGLSPAMFAGLCFLVTVMGVGVVHVTVEAPLRQWGRRWADRIWGQTPRRGAA